MMIRRFVNIVAENYKSSMYSLHGLDVSKHLFYPSTAEAEAAAAKAAASKKNGNGGGRPPVIPRLRRLPAPYMSFQPSPTTLGDSTTMGTFALVSPRSSEGRILCSSDAGHSLLYNADSHFIQTMPSVQGFIGSRPITISTGRPGALEDDLYILRDGAGLSCFHVLRFGSKDRLVHRPSGRKGWHWESLPRPPFSGIINSYTVVDGGRTICVSYNAPDFFGTYCFDTVEREWWEAGDWVLPFEGGAEYVPDLKLWLGFSPSKPHHLCATSDLSAMDQPPTLQHVLPDLDTPENWSAMRFNLLNLGEGRFCIAKVFEVLPDTAGEESDYSPDCETVGNDFIVLTGVELVTSGGGGDSKLEGLRIHKSKRYIFIGDRIWWVL